MKKNGRIIVSFVSLLFLFIFLTGCSPFDFLRPSAPSPSASNPQVSSAPPVSVYERGSWNDGVYRNEFFGFQIALPEDWKADTDEELAERMGTAVENLANGIRADADALRQQISYEFFVYSEKTMSNVNFNIEKLPTYMSEGQYISATKLNLEQMGVDATFGEETSVSIGGNEWKCYPAIVVSQGITLEERIYLLEKDSYMACMTATYSSENSADIDILLSGITPLS